jgi:hypothetical protein
MRALIDGMDGASEWGKEKSCSKQNFPGLFGFGIIEQRRHLEQAYATSSFALVKGVGANASSTRGVVYTVERYRIMYYGGFIRMYKGMFNSWHPNYCPVL